MVLDSLKLKDKKTKDFLACMSALKVGSKVLVAVDEIDENLYASARNAAWCKLVETDNVSVVDLLNVDTLVMSEAAVKKIEEALK